MLAMCCNYNASSSRSLHGWTQRLDPSTWKQHEKLETTWASYWDMIGMLLGYYWDASCWVWFQWLRMHPDFMTDRRWHLGTSWLQANVRQSSLGSKAKDQSNHGVCVFFYCNIHLLAESNSTLQRRVGNAGAPWALTIFVHRQNTTQIKTSVLKDSGELTSKSKVTNSSKKKFEQNQAPQYIGP